MKIAVILLLFLIAPLTFAQDATIPVRFISSTGKTPDRYAGKDTFEWEYTITNNTLRKEKEKGYVEYKNVSLGPIYKVDIQNPLQVVVFYRSFNTVVLLDNQLNETARIDFSELEVPVIADAAGLASQNRLWIFDVTTQRLGLYSQEGNKYKTITSPLNDPIKFYQSDYNNFYWIDVNNQCFVANLFGKINYLGTVPHFDQAQVVSPKHMLLKQENKLLLHNLQTGKGTGIAIVENSFNGFHYAAQILSIFTKTEINQYQITLPE